MNGRGKQLSNNTLMAFSSHETLGKIRIELNQSINLWLPFIGIVEWKLTYLPEKVGFL